MTSKSEWGTPKLIVLGRGTPEEHVLAGCKNDASTGPVKNKCKAETGPGSCAITTPS